MRLRGGARGHASMGAGRGARRGSVSVARAVLQFTAVGLVALLVLSTGSAILLRRTAVKQAVRGARHLALVLGQSVVQPALSEGVAGGDPAALAGFDRLVHERVLRGPVTRVKVWAGDGRIVYSDEPRLIGSRFPLGSDEIAVLHGGGIAAGLSDLRAPENQFERPNHQLLEVYQRVRSPSGRPLLFETYVRFDSVAATGRRLTTAFAPLALGGLLVLELVQVPLAWSLGKRVRDGQLERELLLQRAVAASDAERRRIAADLHDGVVQDLAGLSYSFAAAADRLRSRGDHEGEADMRQAAAATRKNIGDLRSLLVDIYPPNLEQEGLDAALSDLLVPLSRRGITVRHQVPTGLILPAEVESLLFRTAQEAVRNTVAHSGADNVDVVVRRWNGSASLAVVDDGCGFSPGDVSGPRAGHFGLSLLSELATDVGGRLVVSSRPGQGTRIEVEVPVS